MTKKTTNWRELAFDELNLCEIPFGGPGLVSTKGAICFQDTVRDKQVGRQVTRNFRLSPCTDPLSEWQWLPTWKDVDVLLAMLKLAYQQTKFESDTVTFSTVRLWKMLGGQEAKNRKRECKRIGEAVVRWTVHVIQCDHWRTEKGWRAACFVPVSFIEPSTFNLESEQREYSVRFATEIWQNIQAGYKRAFDWDFYLSLKLPTSKRLYRFLGKRFYWSRDVSFPLVDFAREKMGMCRSRKPRDYKYSLKGALNELEMRGYFEELAESERFEKRNGVYRVRFVAGQSEKQRRIVTPVEVRPPPCGPKENRPPRRVPAPNDKWKAIIDRLSVRERNALLKEAIERGPKILVDGFQRTIPDADSKHAAYVEKLLIWRLSQR